MNQTSENQRLDAGVFIISLDFELIWGTLDLFGPEKFRKACELERDVVINRLLDLFVEFDVSATWLILGHLFLDSCRATNGRKHPEIVRPNHSWRSGDWFDSDPCGDAGTANIFYGRDLVDKIKSCPVPQEIGSHSFSHVIFGDEGCSRETAESEMAECVKLAGEQGIKLRSFAFPRNVVGHLDVLRDYGFTCYRGPEPNWYEKNGFPEVFRRMLRLADVLRAARPPVVMPERCESGLWNIPGSTIYFPMHGLRRYIPLSLRVKRAIKGLDAAAESKRVFHLWFHPTNLADETEAMFRGLRDILRHAAELRDRGRLDILPMRSLAPETSSLKPDGSQGREAQEVRIR
ncbi:MAG: polysaccharide deacetylase [Blastocatellales bacterium]